MRTDRRIRLALFVLLAPLPAACGGGGSPAPEPLRVMTRNVYYGADLDPAVAAVESGDLEAIVGAVTQIWADLNATDFPTRAGALADEIAEHQPDLIGLQEAALWRIQGLTKGLDLDPTPATQVVLDFVAELLSALEARGEAYEVVVISENLDAELPFVGEDLSLMELRLTDREVILARSDLAQRGYALSNPVAGHFTANLVLDSGLAALCGWASVDVEGPRGALRFVSAHLEAQVPEIRDAQAVELLSGPLAGPGDVVLVGDLNDDAQAPDPAGAYEMLRASGFVDAWTEVEGALAGATCCYDALLADAAAVLTERLDVVLVRGAFDVQSATIVGADPGRRVAGLWPSDHAGLAAVLTR